MTIKHAISKTDGGDRVGVELLYSSVKTEVKVVRVPVEFEFQLELEREL